MENFDLDLIKQKSQIDAKEYLTKYFIPLKNGNHVFYSDGKYEVIDKDAVKVYFNRMSKELNEFYFKQYTQIKSITYQLNQPLFIGNFVNLCPNLKAKNNKKFEEFSEDVKERISILFQYIKEVLANNSEEMFQYLIKWYANMIRGNKNDSCLYLKGEQGIGKSTITEFLKDFVIGRNLTLETGSEPLKSKFNSILGGKLLVIFEELENFSINEWASVSSVLKRFITSKTYLLESKNINSYETENMNNYMLNSNNDAIKDDDGRRYVILDVNHKYKDNHIYFGNLREKCFNDEIGRAFYSYLIEIDLTGFIPQKYPETNSKLNSHIKRLDKVYEFIKNYFVLQKLDINHTTKELYEKYENYCQHNNLKKIDKTSFHNEKMNHIGLVYKKTNGNTIYKYSWEELYKIAIKLKWLNELDDFNEDKEFHKNIENEIIANKDKEIKELNEQIEEFKLKLQSQKELNEQIEEFKKQIEEFKLKLQSQEKPKKKIIKGINHKVNEVISVTEGKDMFNDF